MLEDNYRLYRSKRYPGQSRDVDKDSMLVRTGQGELAGKRQIRRRRWNKTECRGGKSPMKTDIFINTMQEKLPRQYFNHAIAEAVSTRPMRKRRGKKLRI